MSQKKFRRVELTLKSLKCHDTNDTFMTGTKDEIVIYGDAEEKHDNGAIWPAGEPASFKKGQKKDIDKSITLDFGKEDINRFIHISEIDTGDIVPNLDFTSNDNDSIGTIGFINDASLALKPFVNTLNQIALSGETTFHLSGAKYTLKWSVDKVVYFENT